MNALKYVKSMFFILSATLLCLSTNNVCLAAESARVVEISQEELVIKMTNDKKTLVIDVRSNLEFSRGRIPSSVHIPYKTILNDVSVLDKYVDRDLVFYCHSGTRVKFVTGHLLEQRNRDLYHLKGDFRAWQAEGRPIEK